MFKYFLKKLMVSILCIFLLFTLVFFLVQALPGQPLVKMQNETNESYQERLQAFGLLENVFVRYWKLLKGLFSGEGFGIIYASNNPVLTPVPQKIKYSLMIAGPSFLLTIIIGILLGIICAYYRNKWIDYLINISSSLFVAVPTFIIALYLIKLSGFFHLPTTVILPSDQNATPALIIKSLIIPIISVVITSSPMIIANTRNHIIEIMHQEYVKVALAKGYKMRTIIFKHVLKNAFIPISTVIQPLVLEVIVGSYVLEEFFGVPGMSGYLSNGVTTKETNLVVFGTIFYASLYFLVQLIMDLMYPLINKSIVLSLSNNFNLLNKLKNKIYRQFKILLFSNKARSKNLNTQCHFIHQLLNKIRYHYFVRNNVSSVIKNKQITFKKQKIFVDESNNWNKQLSTFYIRSGDESIQNTYIDIDCHLFKSVDIFGRSNENVFGRPSTYIKDVVRRFFKSKVATLCTIILSFIILYSMIYSIVNEQHIMNPFTNNVPTSLLTNLPPRIPWLGINGVTDVIVNHKTFQAINKLYESGINIYKNVEQEGWTYKIIGFDPYKIPGLENVTLFLGTNYDGADWSAMLWYSTWQSLFLGLCVAIATTIIGTIYGAIAGMRFGKTTDTVMTSFIQVIKSIPSVLLVLIFAVIISKQKITGLGTMIFILTIINWMDTAIMTRSYVINYKNCEFVQAVRTLGASELRILFSHIIPSILGKILVNFVHILPSLLFLESTLTLLGIKMSTLISIGWMIEMAKTLLYWHLILGPTIMLVLISLTSKIIANHISDALNPRIMYKNI